MTKPVNTFLFVALLVSASITNAFSQELVWKKSNHREIAEKLDKNPIYKILRLRRNQRIERNELGSAISPYFTTSTSYFRYFKKINNCYKLTIHETKNLYSSTKCPRKFTNLFVNIDGVIANQIQPTKEYPKSTQITKENDTFTFLAHKNSFREIEDLDQLGKYPTQMINISSNEKFSVVNNKGYITLMNKVEVNRSELGYLSIRTETTEQKMRLDLYSGRDFIFKDSDHNYYFYKRFQPKPFTLGFLRTSEKFLNHLDSLNDLLYSYKDTNRCFRSDLILKTKFDCDTLIFKAVSIGSWDEMGLVKVDYRSQSYELIN